MMPAIKECENDTSVATAYTEKSVQSNYSRKFVKKILQKGLFHLLTTELGVTYFSTKMQNAIYQTLFMNIYILSTTISVALHK